MQGAAPAIISPASQQRFERPWSAWEWTLPGLPGWLALAYPGPHHLAELVDRFGLMQQHAGKTDRYAEAMQRWVGPSTAVRIVHRLGLDRESIRHAVLMGPNARHIAASALDVAAAMDVTIDIAMLFARKPG
jgi:hypothetical protein